MSHLTDAIARHGLAGLIFVLVIAAALVSRRVMNSYTALFIVTALAYVNTGVKLVFRFK